MNPIWNNCLLNYHKWISVEENFFDIQSPIENACTYFTATVHTKVIFINFWILIPANRSIRKRPTFRHWFSIFAFAVHSTGMLCIVANNLHTVADNVRVELFRPFTDLIGELENGGSWHVVTLFGKACFVFFIRTMTLSPWPPAIKKVSKINLSSLMCFFSLNFRFIPIIMTCSPECFQSGTSITYAAWLTEQTSRFAFARLWPFTPHWNLSEKQLQLLWNYVKCELCYLPDSICSNCVRISLNSHIFDRQSNWIFPHHHLIATVSIAPYTSQTELFSEHRFRFDTTAKRPSNEIRTNQFNCLFRITFDSEQLVPSSAGCDVHV